MPVGIGQQPLVIATAVLSANVPLLGSNKLLERSGAVIDMGKGMVYFSVLDVTVPLVQMGGHFTIDLLDFPTDTPNKLACWKEITNAEDWTCPDSELILPVDRINKATSTAALSQEEEPVSTPIRPCPPDVPATSAMDDQLEHRCGRRSQHRQVLHHSDDHGSEVGASVTRLADPASSRTPRTSGSKPVHPCPDKTAWERSRPICKVPSVRTAVQMEPQQRAMGAHGIIALITIAIAMLREQKPSPGQKPLL